jgi:hypothetical protein
VLVLVRCMRGNLEGVCGVYEILGIGCRVNERVKERGVETTELKKLKAVR